MTELHILEISPCLIGLVLSGVILNRMRLYSTSGMFFRKVEEEKKLDSVVEIGGLALLPIMLASLCLTLGLPQLMGYEGMGGVQVMTGVMRIMQIMAGCSLLYVVGLKNDMHGTDYRNKFLALLVAAAMFPASGLWINNLQGLFGLYAIPEWVGMPLTVILAMYVTEMIALFDDIDGLGVGLTTVTGGLFFGLCLYGNFILGALVASALLGVALPYLASKMLRASWRKTLVGNSGSYVIGYVLAYLTVSLIEQSGDRLPVGILMVVVGIVMVPMFDTLRILRTRMREGRALLTPDRNQMQHRLIRLGLPSALTPFCIMTILVAFAYLNTVWVMRGYDLTLLAVVDAVALTTLELGISYGIRNCENKQSRRQWSMEYGREAWEANPPVEVIARKRRNFGTMGLPKEVILGEEIDFIPDGMNAAERNMKRLFDLLTSLLLLLLTSPLWLLCYVLIKLDDGAPVLYAQERLGRFGRPFRIYKFRTMRVDAECQGPALSHAGGDDDPRLTRVGRFLRVHHLDELPQLWNVCTGDMAFIGYRPERKFFIDQIMEHDPRYAFLYQIRPGVTSYATLYNGYTDTMEKMLRRLNYDLYYLEHRSFWFDLRILWLTFISIVFGKKF